VWRNTQLLISVETGILTLNSQDCIGGITFAHNQSWKKNSAYLTLDMHNVDNCNEVRCLRLLL